MPLKPPFDELRAWLIDMDGVLYRGSDPLPGASEFIETLQQGDYAFLFLTNNATKTPEQVVGRLQSMGIDAGVDSVYTSAMATVAHLLEHYPPPRRVLIVGGAGIQSAIPEAGYERVNRAEQADLVVCALDQHATYEHMAEAALAIRAGAPWIATNPDPSLPGERGILPGAGSIIAFLAAATDQEPLVIGKPETVIFDQALALLGASREETVMVGDRLTTDILGGHRAGLKTLCVLTGIATPDDAAHFAPQPDWIVPDLPAILVD